MSITLNNIISDGNVYSPSTLLNSINQNSYLVSDSFTSSDSIRNWLPIDLNDRNDSGSNILATFSINTSVNTLTITQNSAPDYRVLGISNRYMHGRNKLIQVTINSGVDNSPIIYTRFTDTSNMNLAYINPVNQRLETQTIVSNSANTFIDSYIETNNSLTPINIPNFSTSTVYQMTVKTFENVLFVGLVNTSTSKLIRNYSFFSSVFADASGNRNGLGLTNNSGSRSVVFKDFSTKDIHNFINVVCLGDSNTAGNWNNPPTLLNSGNTYVQLLNQKYLDKNIVFTNAGVSGIDTYQVKNNISNLVLSRRANGARNIVTILLGTNDASELNNSWNFTTTQNNFRDIFTSLKQHGFSIWVLTYPPRNQNPTGSGTPSQSVMNTHNLRVSQINGFLRSMNGTVDRIIPLDNLFRDPTTSTNTYDNSFSTYVDNANIMQAGSGFIHFTELGHRVIQRVIASAIDEAWYESPQLKHLTLSKSLNILGLGNSSYSSNLSAADTNTGEGTINTGGQIVFSGKNTSSNLNNTLCFSQSGLAPPSNTSRSLGTRLILFPALTNNVNADFAIGIHNLPVSFMWYGVSGTSDEHRFYHNTTLGLQMNAALATFNQNVAITSTTASTNATTGALTVAGGVGISGTVNVSNAIFTSQSLCLLAQNTTGGNTENGGTSNSTRYLSLFDNPILFRSSNGGDRNHYLMYGSIPFSIDGPALVGFSGGVLASSNSGLYSLRWTNTGNVQIRNNCIIDGTTASTNATTGALTVAGGVGISGTVNTSGDITSSGVLNITNNTDANFLGGGAVIVSGGMSVLNVFRTSRVLVGNANQVSLSPTVVLIGINSASTQSGTGALVINGGIGITNTTDAVSFTNGGSLTTAGGIAIAKSLWVGTTLNLSKCSGQTTNPVTNGNTTNFSTTGVIGTVSVNINNIPVNGNYTYTVTNSFVTTNSIIIVSTTNPDFNVSAFPNNGSINIQLKNLSGSIGTNVNIPIHFIVMV